MEGNEMSLNAMGNLPLNNNLSLTVEIDSFNQDTTFNNSGNTVGSANTAGVELNLGFGYVYNDAKINASAGLHVFNSSADYSGQKLPNQAVIGQQYKAKAAFSIGDLMLSLDGRIMKDGNSKSHDLRTNTTLGGNLEYRTDRFSLSGRIAFEREGGDQTETSHLFYGANGRISFGTIADLFGERPRLLDDFYFTAGVRGGKHLKGSEIKFAEGDRKAGLFVGIGYDSPVGEITLSGNFPNKEISIKWHYGE